jgi:hypothetical protein
MSIIIRARYCGETKDEPDHRIEVGADGSVRMLDHDRTTLEAFTAFGADKPQCLHVFKLLREPEPGPLVDILHENGQSKVLADIGLTWADHVLGLIDYYTGEKEPEMWLRLARQVLDGEGPPEDLALANEAFDDVRERIRTMARESQYSSEITAARDANHSVQGAVNLVDEVVSGARLDFGGMLKALGRSAYHAMGEDALAQGGTARDEDRAKQDEVAWQRLAAIKAAEGLDLKTVIMW